MRLHKLKTPLIYLFLGIAVVFLVATLRDWIFADMARLVPMAVFIGVLLALIFWALHYLNSRDEK